MNLGLISTLRLFVLTGLTGAVMGYATVLKQPLYAQQVPLPEEKPTLAYFPKLPPAKEKVVAAVQKFRDLTDQYKQARPGLTETAPVTTATPNFTSILLNTLEESGWFTPIESGNAVSLLNERRTTGEQNGSQQKAGEGLPAVPSANLFIEGGVLSHDVNTINDANADQYFGRGITRYQQDRVTIYLRAVSTRSGKILNTIYTAKTILSKPVDERSFRYISFKRPGEAETGLTPTEPGELAVTEAIKKAVQGLIIEGVRDGLWFADESSATAMRAVISTYEQEKTEVNEPDMFGIQPAKGLFHRRPQIEASYISIHPYGGILRYSGDYARRDAKGTYGASVEKYITPVFGLQVNAATGLMSSRDAFSVNLTSLEGNLVLRPLPYQHWTPIFFGGMGLMSRSRSSPFQLYGPKYGQVQGGVGVQFSPNNTIGFRSTLSYHQPFTDALDGRITGDHKDYYTRFTLGILIHAGRFLPKTRPIVLRPAASPGQ